jgi:carbonic anhydrase
MNYKKLIYCIIGITTFSCSTALKKGSVSSEKVSLNSNHVLTLHERDSLTPDLVIKELIEGNNRFKVNDFTYRNHSEEVRKTTTTGQFPKAIVLSCIDSRVLVEDVFDQGYGDVFVARVAGNVANTDIIGSMEFACKVSGAKVIIVMGHQHCGALKGAIDNVNLGNIISIVEKIKPAVTESQNFEGEKTSKNENFVKAVAKINIKNTINEIRSKSEILRTMELKGDIKIIGFYYTLSKGELELIN